MISRLTKIAAGLIGLILVSGFVIGLSISISVGFAGFYGGLPFMIIVVFVLLLAAYDVWDECVRNKRE